MLHKRRLSIALGLALALPVALSGVAHADTPAGYPPTTPRSSTAPRRKARS
jgi:iron(III) transport system substrate-binding protein